MQNQNFALEEFSQDVWTRYGFKGNPFDTKALSTLPDDPLPVSEAIVGRDQKSSEFRLLTNILKIPGGGRVVVEGEIGVGKTTFVNYHRFLWEYMAKDKLFTTLHEISVLPEWKLKDFLLNILSGLVTKLLNCKPEFVNSNPLMQEILVLTKVFFTNSYQIQGSLFWVGAGFGKGQEATVPQVSEAMLIYYLENMVKEIKNLGYAGIILQFDDMELISRRSPKTIRNFLDDIRNILQLPDIYYIFIGHPGFFSEIISPLERVRSIFFGYPIFLPPLTQQQTLEALERRYQILATKAKIIKPAEDAFIEKLYDLYNGKIRFIMDAMTLIVPEFSKASTITATQGYTILKRLVAEKVQRVLTAQELQFLKTAANYEIFTNKDIGRYIGLSATHVSHCLSRLQELNFVYLHQQRGRNRYYKVTEDVKIIKDEKAMKAGLVNKIARGKNSKTSLSRKTRERLANAESAVLKVCDRISCKDYSQKFEISMPTARRDLAILVDRGNIYRLKEGRNVYYKWRKK